LTENDIEVIAGETTRLSVEMTSIPGSIVGVVTEAARGPIEGVLVEAIGPGVSDLTNIDGEYTLPDLSPDFYDVSFTHDNYEPYTENNVEVTSGDITELNVSLSIIFSVDAGVSAV